MEHRNQTTARAIQPPQLPKHMKAADDLGGPLVDDAEFAGVRVVRADIGGIVTRNVTLSRVHLEHCALAATHLTGATLRDVRFTVCDCSQAGCDEAFIQRGEFIESRLLGWHAAKAHLRDVVLRECNANYAILAATKCESVRFERCLLQQASFVDADLRGVVFDRCDLTGANLQGATLAGADLRGSTLDGIRVNLKDLRGAVIDLPQAAILVQMLGVVVKLG